MKYQRSASTGIVATTLLRLIMVSALHCSINAQEGVAPPKLSASDEHKDQEQIKVLTEEVRLPIVAFDEFGHADPSLEVQDVLVLEDNVPQEVRSVRRVPAKVLLLVDMGGSMTLVNNVDIARQIAATIISRLRVTDEVAFVQFTNIAEVLVDWTTDTEKVLRMLDPKKKHGKMLPGRMSKAVLGIMAAEKLLEEKSVGNTHVVFITSSSGFVDNDARTLEAFESLRKTQTTMHVISYSTILRQSINKRNRSIFDLDSEMKRWFKDYAEATKRGEEQLAVITKETDGRFFSASSIQEAVDQSKKIVRDIQAQYVLTYTPKRALSSTTGRAQRHIRVVSRRVGLHINALRTKIFMND